MNKEVLIWQTKKIMRSQNTGRNPRAGLVKKTVRVAGSRIDVYFTADELREKYPGVPILVETSAGACTKK